MALLNPYPTWIDLLDLTRLEAPAGDDDAVADLCRRARTRRGNVAAVCVYSGYVGLACDLLSDSGIAIATVTNFPYGDQKIEQVLAEVGRALDDGATEIDVVVPYRRWLQGDTISVPVLLDHVADLCAGRALIKAILETGLITSAAERQALAWACVRPGVAYLKTSTGKACHGATPEGVEDLVHVLARLRDAGRPMGLKIAGGVRTMDELQRYYDIIVKTLGSGFVQSATLRIGASSLLDELLAASPHD
ncbi:deoxyribose-phosphate aldolase [Acidiferrobacter sp.]